MKIHTSVKIERYWYIRSTRTKQSNITMHFYISAVVNKCHYYLKFILMLINTKMAALPFTIQVTYSEQCNNRSLYSQTLTALITCPLSQKTRISTMWKFQMRHSPFRTLSSRLRAKPAYQRSHKKYCSKVKRVEWRTL